MTPQELGAHLAARIPGAVPTVSYDELTLDVPTAAWLDAASVAISDPDVACDYFDWLSAVDDQETVAVVAHLYSPHLRHHLRLRTRVEPGSAVPTLASLFRGADWHERETREMFGVTFIGASVATAGGTAAGTLSRAAAPLPLLLPDGFEGTPLRKDFVLASRVVAHWPGLVEPGEAAGDRRPTLPPGVPEPGTWPARALPPGHPLAGGDGADA